MFAGWEVKFWPAITFFQQTFCNINFSKVRFYTLILFPGIFENSLTFPDQPLIYKLIACGMVSARNALIVIFLAFSHSKNFKYTCCLPNWHRCRNRVVTATVTTSLNIGRNTKLKDASETHWSKRYQS